MTYCLLDTVCGIFGIESDSHVMTQPAHMHLLYDSIIVPVPVSSIFGHTIRKTNMPR